MAENIVAVETHDRLIPNINGRTSSQDWSSNTLAEIRKYTKQELLSFFKPIDALPDGFTQWDAIVSIACLEPENKAYPSFEIDKDNSINPEYKPRSAGVRGLSTGERGRGRGARGARGASTRGGRGASRPWAPREGIEKQRGPLFADTQLEPQQRPKIMRAIAMDSEWFYRDPFAKLQGPFTIAKFIELVESSKQSPEVLVKQEGDDEFLVLKDVIESAKEQATNNRKEPQQVEAQQPQVVQEQPQQAQLPSQQITALAPPPPQVATSVTQELIKEEEQEEEEHLDYHDDHIHQSVLNVLKSGDDEDALIPNSIIQQQQQLNTTAQLQRKPWAPNSQPLPIVATQGYSPYTPSPQSATIQFGVRQPMQEEEVLKSVLQNPSMPMQSHYATPIQYQTSYHAYQQWHAGRMDMHTATQFSMMQPQPITASQLEDQLTKAFQNQPVPPRNAPPSQHQPPMVHQQQEKPMVEKEVSKPKPIVKERNTKPALSEKKTKDNQKKQNIQQEKLKHFPTIVEEDKEEEEEEHSEEEKEKYNEEEYMVQQTVSYHPTPIKQALSALEKSYLPPTQKPKFEQYLPQQLLPQQQSVWNTAPVAPSNMSSLLEIQKIQAKETKKQKQERKQDQKKLAEEQELQQHGWQIGSQTAPSTSLFSIQAEQSKHEHHEQIQQPVYKSISSVWGSNTFSTIKSLEEIQRDELTAKNASEKQPVQTQQLTIPLNVVAKQKEAISPPVKVAWAIPPQVQQQAVAKKEKTSMREEPEKQTKPVELKKTEKRHAHIANPTANSKQSVEKHKAPQPAQTQDDMFWNYGDTQYNEEDEEVAPQPVVIASQQTAMGFSKTPKQQDNKKSNKQTGSFAAVIAGQKSSSSPDIFDKNAFPTLKATPKEAKQSQQQQQKVSSNKSDTIGNVTVSSDFKGWYKTSVERLGKKYESSLMMFLLSLKSEDEISEYLTEYVGNSATAQDFIEEFKRFRSFEISMKSQKSQNSSSSTKQTLQQAGQKKKGAQKKKKKETIDPSLLGFHTEKRTSMIQNVNELEDN